MLLLAEISTLTLFLYLVVVIGGPTIWYIATQQAKRQQARHRTARSAATDEMDEDDDLDDEWEEVDDDAELDEEEDEEDDDDWDDDEEEEEEEENDDATTPGLASAGDPLGLSRTLPVEAGPQMRTENPPDWRHIAGWIALGIGALGFVASAAIGGGDSLGGAITAGILNPLFFIGVPLGLYWLNSVGKQTGKPSLGIEAAREIEHPVKPPPKPAPPVAQPVFPVVDRAGGSWLLSLGLTIGVAAGLAVGIGIGAAISTGSVPDSERPADTATDVMAAAIPAAPARELPSTAVVLPLSDLSPDAATQSTPPPEPIGLSKASDDPTPVSASVPVADTNSVEREGSGTFGRGSTTEAVLLAQGKPVRVRSYPSAKVEIWVYGGSAGTDPEQVSEVDFMDGTVVDWRDGAKCLKVREPNTTTALPSPAESRRSVQVLRPPVDRTWGDSRDAADGAITAILTKEGAHYCQVKFSGGARGIEGDRLFVFRRSSDARELPRFVGEVTVLVARWSEVTCRCEGFVPEKGDLVVSPIEVPDAGRKNNPGSVE